MRIAITASHGCDVAGEPHPGVAPYARAVERAGAAWTIAPNDAHAVGAVLAGVDAVIVSGGVDVDPKCYGGRADHARSQTGRYRADRDAFELALVRATRARGIPTLAICRGMQVANVAFGGTLIEDVREELGAGYTIEHRQTDEAGRDREDYAPGHEVDLDASSGFARLIGATCIATNSMHHQAVRAIGEGLRVVGRTSDGMIEVLEASFAHPFFIAVQWHPEALVDEVSLRLFASLANLRRYERAGSP